MRSELGLQFRRGGLLLRAVKDDDTRVRQASGAEDRLKILVVDKQPVGHGTQAWHGRPERVNATPFAPRYIPSVGREFGLESNTQAREEHRRTALQNAPCGAAAG